MYRRIRYFTNVLTCIHITFFSTNLARPVADWITLQVIEFRVVESFVSFAVKQIKRNTHSRPHTCIMRLPFCTDYISIVFKWDSLPPLN
jgi:hypothetical protein